MLRNKLFLLTFLIILIIVAIVIYFSNLPIVVEYTQVKYGDIVPSISAYGEVKGNIVALSSKMPLLIENIRVKEGDFVKKGEVLVEFENFENQKNEYEATKKLYENSLASLSQLERAANAFENTMLVSPFNGVVVEVANKVGETAAVGIPIIKIVDPHTKYLELQVDESDIGVVKLGQKVEINVDAYPEKKFFGKVVQISNIAELRKTADRIKIDEEDKVIRVKVLPDKLFEELKIGMTVNADIITEEKNNVLILPREAVFSKDGKYFVYLIKENKAKIIEVKLGLKDSDNVEILSGLKENDLVINPIPEKIKDNVKVKIVKNDRNY